jgi:hypothetical protein
MRSLWAATTMAFCDTSAKSEPVSYYISAVQCSRCCRNSALRHARLLIYRRNAEPLSYPGDLRWLLRLGDHSNAKQCYYTKD